MDEQGLTGRMAQHIRALTERVLASGAGLVHPPESGDSCQVA